MSSGFKERLLNAARVGSAALTLTTASGTFESPKNFGRNSQNPQSVSAAELNSPLEQAPIGDINADTRKLLQAIENLDLKTVLSFLPKPDAKYFNTYKWGFWEEPRPDISRAEMVKRLEYVISDPAPACIGVIWEGRVIKIPMIVSKPAGYMHELGDRRASGVMGFSLTPSPEEARNVLLVAREIPKDKLSQVMSSVEPCGSLLTRPPEKLTTEMPPIPDLPQGFKDRKIAFMGHVGMYQQIFVSNLDGSGVKQLTFDKAGKGRIYWLDKRWIATVFQGKEINGIVLIDTETGQQKIVTDIPGDDGADNCIYVDQKSGLIYHSRYIGLQDVRLNPSHSDLYVTDPKTGKSERLTQDNVNNAEDCPALSPNGRYLAFRVYNALQPRDTLRPALPQNIVVYERDKIKSFNPNNLPDIIEGAEPLFWSNDSKWLYFTRARYTNSLVSYSLQRLEVATGKVEDLLLSNISGASPVDGEWIVSSHQSKDSTKVFAKQPGNLLSTKQLFESDLFIAHIAVQPKIFVPERNIVTFHAGLGSTIRNGKYISGTFNEAMSVLRDQMGYEDNEIILASLAGNDFLQNGRITTRDQDCFDLLRNQDHNSEAVLQHWRDLDKYRANYRKVDVGHSLATIRLLRALQRIKDEKLDININGARIVLVNGPIIGLRTYAFEWVSAQFNPDKIDEDCNITVGSLDLSIPLPVQMNFPAIVELGDMWVNRKQRRKELAELTEWMKNHGAEIITLGNANDCVVALGSCFLTEFDLEVALMAGTDPDSLAMYTQYVPGATNIMRFFGFGDTFGHSQYFRTEEGLAILTTVIGKQKKN